MINDYTHIFYSHQAPQCNKYTMNCVEFKRRGRDCANSICMNSVHIEKKMQSQDMWCTAPAAASCPNSNAITSELLFSNN